MKLRYFSIDNIDLIRMVHTLFFNTIETMDRRQVFAKAFNVENWIEDGNHIVGVKFKDENPDGWVYSPLFLKGHMVPDDTDTGKMNQTLLDDLILPSIEPFAEKINSKSVVENEQVWFASVHRHPNTCLAIVPESESQPYLPAEGLSELTFDQFSKIESST